MCLSSDWTLDALSSCVTEDKLTWEWLSHQSLSFCAHLRLWATRPKFCHQSEFKKEIWLWHWLDVLLVPIVWPFVFSGAPEYRRSRRFTPLSCAFTSSQESRLHSFIYFAAKSLFCRSEWSLKSVLMLHFGLMSAQVQGRSSSNRNNSYTNYFFVGGGRFLFISRTDIKFYS